MPDFLPPQDVSRILEDQRYFAFIDVLGYRDVLFGETRGPEERRVQTLYEVWECLYTVIRDSIRLFEQQVEPVLFSDSLYLSSIDPVGLAGCVAQTFAAVAAFHSQSPDSWMPFLRGGISYGWGIDVRDPTLPRLENDLIDEFRNPAGPGPACAYILAEKSQLKGMRVRVTEMVKTQVVMDALGVAPTDLPRRAAADRFRRRPWPDAGRVALPVGETDTFDLPWWRFMGGGAAEALHVVNLHAWQAGPAGGDGARQIDATREVLTAATHAE